MHLTLYKKFSTGLQLLAKPVAIYLGGGWQLAPNPKDISEPSRGRVTREKFQSIYVVKGVWNMFTVHGLNIAYVDVQEK